MTVTDADRLRALLGESIDEGGEAGDTLFSDDEINDLLTRGGSVEGALGEAWEMKAAKLSNLVDIVEGDQRRSLSQAHKQALAMARHFLDKGTIGTANSHIHKINRTGIFKG